MTFRILSIKCVADWEKQLEDAFSVNEKSLIKVKILLNFGTSKYQCFRYSQSDPPENCHLTVKKLTKT